MNDEPDGMVIRYLRRIDVKLDRLIKDVGDLQGRMTGMETSYAGVSRRLVRIEGRLEHIETRPDFVDPTMQANA